MTITIDAARYADSDHCLTDAAADYIAAHPALAGYDLSPRWGDEQRDTILLDVPEWAIAAQTLGRRGGAATKGVSTPRKTAAARANGARGGRPRLARTVRIVVRTVGQAFGVVADLRDVRTGRRLAVTLQTRPYGHRAAAHDDGVRLAEANGWTVASGDNE